MSSSTSQLAYGSYQVIRNWLAYRPCKVHKVSRRPQSLVWAARITLSARLIFATLAIIMKTGTSPALIGALLSVGAHAAAVPVDARDVDTRFPYTGPDVPVGDWVNPTVKGNGKGFPRLVEQPAVKPSSSKPSNNVNVISLAYIPKGVNIHYQTPFGLGSEPTVHWGTSKNDLCNKATGKTNT